MQRGIQGEHPYRGWQEPTARPGRRAPAIARLPFARSLLAASVGVGIWGAAIGWREHRLNIAVAALPRVVQEQSYRRAYDELATVCASQPALEAHCREQAELIVRFPQCKEECWSLTRRLFPTATK